MARGWSASSLIPAGLGGLNPGSGIVTRGTLSGGVSPAAPMNTINSTMPSGSGIPPFVSSALNPFLNAVIGQQNQPQQPARPPSTINIVNQADILRAETQQAQQRAAQAAAANTDWEINRVRNQLNNIPTGFGGMALGGFGPQRADLQMRLFGLQNQLGRQQASFSQPMGGWSNTFAIPTY